jgi:hypothetical protein
MKLILQSGDSLKVSIEETEASTKESKTRIFPIGFDSEENIAMGCQASISNRPQLTFKPKRLIIPKEIASYFLIEDIKIGYNSQLLSNGKLPSAVFTEEDNGISDFDMDACEIGQKITIDVLNVSNNGHRFLAMMLGEV